MFFPILLFIACALVAFASVPLIMRIVPPNPYYGINLDRISRDHDLWLLVNSFLGWALLVASGLMALGLAFYQGTWWLGHWWEQIFMFVFLIGCAIGATLWFALRVR
jgi:hypothetical protein